MRRFHRPRRAPAMAAYLIRRLWQMIPTLIGVVLLVFLLFKGFGGDPAEILAGLNASQQQVDAIRQQLGLNDPWWVQLWINVRQIVTFEWGRSWATNESVANIFATRLPNTLPVMLALMEGLAPQTRLYRTFFLDELGQDYVRTARAKGLTERSVLFKHVLRNAMIPILTNIGLALPGVFVGSFLIEVFFSIPGLGREVILAVNRSDYPVIQATTVYLAMLTML